eukprot:scaffold6161_cov376-Prasinococcus_capsulatus_cf.AAC.4
MDAWWQSAQRPQQEAVQVVRGGVRRPSGRRHRAGRPLRGRREPAGLCARRARHHLRVASLQLTRGARAGGGRAHGAPYASEPAHAAVQAQQDRLVPRAQRPPRPHRGGTRARHRGDGARDHLALEDRRAAPPQAHAGAESGVPTRWRSHKSG